MCRSCGLVFPVWCDSCACIWLCSVRVANGHCLAVIQLCSFYLDCQVRSKRAYDLSPFYLTLCRCRVGRRATRSPVHTRPCNVFLFCKRYSEGYFLKVLMQHFNRIPKIVNSVLLNPFSPGSWQHLCVVGNGSLVCAPSELPEWNVFESLASVTLVEAVAVLFYSSSVT